MQNPKLILENYAKDNGFENTCVFVDDGYTGVNFERPGFKQIFEMMEKGQVATLITKDDCVIIELNAESPIKAGFPGCRKVGKPCF